MIKIQGFEIHDPTEPEGLADLIESMVHPDFDTKLVAEKLFGLLVILENASDDDRNVIIERAQNYAYLHTVRGRADIEEMRKTILHS